LPATGEFTSPSSRSAEADRAAPAAVRCRLVASPFERELHLRIRAEVFVREQGLFTGGDRDAHDDDPLTLHVLAWCGTEPAGTVRLYRLSTGQPGLWKGDRLAVLPRFRRHGVGAPLVDFAVRAAGELGGREMVAQIQLANVAFFERLGWRRLGEVADYCGRPHQQMVIGLSGAAGRSPARG
jgi:putative N-acetyltransferase (TIGR04045 family)